jgi:hypothetical protein
MEEERETRPRSSIVCSAQREREKREILFKHNCGVLQAYCTY